MFRIHNPATGETLPPLAETVDPGLLLSYLKGAPDARVVTVGRVRGIPGPATPPPAEGAAHTTDEGVPVA